MEREVHYDKEMFRRIFWILWVVILALPLLAYGFIQSNNPVNKVEGVFILVLFALMVMIAVQTWKKVRGSIPALVILDDGLVIGMLPFEDPFPMPWSEIACVYESGGFICILPEDQDGFLKARPWLARTIGLPTLGRHGSCLLWRRYRWILIGRLSRH